MAFDHTKMADTLGAELQALRGMEATWEWFSKLSGANTYFKDKINTVYDNTVQAEDDTELASKANLADTSPGTGLPGTSGLASLAKAAHDNRVAAFEAYFFAYMDVVLNTGQPDRDAGSITYGYDPQLLANGQASILTRQGRWAALSKQMTADSKVLKRNAVVVGTFAGDSGNIGSALSSSSTGSDHTFAGQVVLTCTDDTVGSVKMAAVLNVTVALLSKRRGGNGASSESQIVGDNALQLGQPWQDGETGLAITMTLNTLSTTGDGFTIFSAVAIATPTEADSAKGKHHIKVTHILVGGAGPNWQIDWFNSADRDPVADLVASVQITGEAGSVAFTMNGSGSTITGTFSKANAFANLPNLNDNDNDIVFDIRQPRIGDIFRYTVTNDEAGNFATKIGRRYPVSLPSDAAAVTYTDTKASSVAMT